MDWQSAAHYCHSIDSRLVVIQDAHDQAELTKYLSSQKGMYAVYGVEIGGLSCWVVSQTYI